MARDRYEYDEVDEQAQRPPKKADVILKRQQEMAAKQQEVLEQNAQTNALLDRILQAVSAGDDGDGIASLADGNAQLYEALGDESASLKRDLKFLAAQNESIFLNLTEKIKKLSEQLEELKTAKPEQEEEPVAEAEPAAEVDYELLADKVAERIPAPQIVTDGEAVQTVVQQAEIDYELLADKVAARIPVAETLEPVQVSAEIDYDLLAEKVAQRIPAPAVTTADGEIDLDALAEKVAQRIQLPEQVAQTEIDADELADKVAQRIQLPAAQTIVAAAPAETVHAEVNADEIAEQIISRIPVQEAVSADYIASKVAEQIIIPAAQTATAEIDYDALAQKVAELMPAPQVVTAYGEAAPASVQLDEEELANKIAEKLGTQSNDILVDEEGCSLISKELAENIDYDALAQKVAKLIPAPQVVTDGEAVQTVIRETAEVDYDLIASKVAEQIVLPEVAATAAVSELDEEELANKIAEKLGTQSNDILVDDEGCSTITREIVEKLDYDAIAQKVAELLGETLENSEDEEAIDYDEMAARISEKITVAGVNEDAIAEKAAAVLSNYLPEFDTDEVADKVTEKIINALPANEAVEIDNDAISAAVAEKIMEQQAERDYDIVVDEDGLDRIAEAVAERLANAEEEQPDYEEMARRISDNITVAGVDEDAIAQKAAAVLSEYVFNTDEIADKVAEKVIEAFPEEEYDEEAEEAQYQEEVNEFTEIVTKGTEERFDAIDKEIAEIKQMLESGVCVVRENDDEIAGAEACEEVYEEETEEPEEALVTVSDVIADEETTEETEEFVEEQPEEIIEEPAEEPEEQVEELTEEPAEEAEEPVEEQPAEETEELVEEPVEETVEEQVEAEAADEAEENEEEELIEEFTYEDLVNVAENAANDNGEDSDDESEEGEGGVDFANMMRYNRSFIARIIQGTDEQKTYYGEVRNALLSYKKVNSNIAWGAERFHKGRETIARFKIRGKTLVVYLALDPKEHEYSVYFHKDVSDNKSVAGTPMMIKVKSPLGVKKAIRLIDEMLQARNGEKRNVPQRDYAAMYPYETIEELIEDGLVKDVKKDK